jgi:hypothetical protein
MELKYGVRGRGLNLAAEKHRWVDFCEKFAGFAECREYLYWVGNCQLVEKNRSL